MTDLLVVLIYAAIAGAVLILLRGAIDVVPLSRSRRDAARRAMPVVTAVAALVVAVLAVRRLLAPQPVVAAIAMLLVVAAFLVASWSALRDVASGVFLKAGQVCREGDAVRIDDMHGRVAKMGLRALVLETSEGEEAVIPFGRIARERLVRAPASDGLTPHVFRLPLPADGRIADLKQEIRRRALLVHWSAVSREPEVSVADHELEITVFSIDPDRGPDIETAIRAALPGRSHDGPSSHERPSAPPSARDVHG